MKTTRAVLRVLCPLLMWAASAAAASAQPWSQTRMAGEFSRANTVVAGQAQKVNSIGTLAGNAGPVTGWFEYDFSVPATGWYELAVQGSAGEVEFILDPDDTPATAPVLGGNGSGRGARVGEEKIGNFWLTEGKHRVRLQRYFWTGFPNIRGIVLRASDGELSHAMSARLESAGTAYRIGECPGLLIETGANNAPHKLTVWVYVPGAAVRQTLHVEIPPSKTLSRQKLGLPCSEEGNFAIGFGDADKRIETSEVRDISYEVIDTRQGRPRPYGSRTLVQTIDLTKQSPDFSGGESSRVINGPAGRYRQGGSKGWMGWQNLPAMVKAAGAPPSWFAYVLEGVTLQKPHVVEIDYPDDALRGFTIALKESAPLAYPVAGGVDCGGEFSLSNGMRTHTLSYWPRASGTRIVFISALDGHPAAAARIRVYRLDDEPASKTAGATPSGGRLFANWYEEGSNFLAMYGAPDQSPRGYQIAAERWARSIALMGGNVLMPTVSVYSFNLYPSRYNRAFSIRPDYDVMRRLLLAGEKHGVGVIPELHPRADELGWDQPDVPGPRANQLVSKDGKTQAGFPPHYNPLYPANQDWYVAMVGELADNYAWSPALRGISLRLMQWANPTLNNLHSIKWGYDDFTVGLFVKERGIKVPLGEAGDDGRFNMRYRWIMANAKAAWIDWRCEKIAQLYARLAERLRKARPDLKLYSTVFDAYPSNYGADWLREAGIDPARLNRIPGVVLINALHAYGRRYDASISQGTRDNLIEPDMLNALRPQAGQGSFLSYARYMEAIEAVVPPKELGFPPATAQTWISGVTNPADRHVLERYALQLAETDATFLGDGGNAYTLGQPLLSEFVREYTALPATAFTPRSDARDPVAVWELSENGKHWFYAVNRERYPVTLKIRTKGSGRFAAIVDGTEPAMAQGVFELALEPYQLRAFRGPVSLLIDSVSSEVPKVETERLSRQVAWLAQFAQDAQGVRGLLLTTEQRALLQKYAEAAAADVKSGRLRSARSTLENHRLLQIYARMSAYPPELRQNGSAD